MAKRGTLRVVIVWDGLTWYVRRLRVLEHDLDRNEKVYRCDMPIANDCETGEDALRAALEAIAKNAGAA